jgi:aminotransferase
VTAASTISQKAAVEALAAGINDAQAMREIYQERRDFAYQKMTNLGFEVARPNGTFYLFAKIPEGYEQDSMKFCISLAQEVAIAIIPGIAFGPEGEGYVRISYALEMEKLAEAMKRLERFMAK